MTEQQTLFDWFRAKSAPRGAISRTGLDEESVADEGIRRLHQRLESALGTVDLVVTNNRKRMVTAKRKGKRHELRVHHMFVDADDTAVSALIGLARGESASRGALREFIRDNRDAISHKPSQASVRTDGSHHDLDDILSRATALLHEHGDELSELGDPERDATRLDDVQITWGRRGRGSRSIRFGSYDFQQHLVRIHPALDEPWVPGYFVDFVVYHELLHVVIGVQHDSGGRRILHPPEFRDLEARFPRYEEAIAWERENLGRILDR